MKMTLAALAAAALPLAALAQPAPMSARTQAEIRHLFSYISQSGCRFERNGGWADTGAARDHVEMKYQYLRERGMIASAEDFIDKAASRSSLSGKDYLVQCPGSGAISTGGWLRTELDRFRRGS
jgi:uncharacterized protein DUF5329